MLCYVKILSAGVVLHAYRYNDKNSSPSSDWFILNKKGYSHDQVYSTIHKIKRRKTNLPVERRLHWVWQKTTEGGRRIRRTSPIGETVGKLRKISGWTWQTLPKTVFCKVIAVLKNHQFICNIKCFLFMTFFVWYVCSVRLGQLMTSLETSTNALYTPTYWLLRLTISGKTNILRKTR